MNLKPIFSRIKFNGMKAPHPTRHLNRIEKLAAAIQERFPEINRPEKIKLKHAKWLITHWLEEKNYKTATRNDYLSSLKFLIEVSQSKPHQNAIFLG